MALVVIMRGVNVGRHRRFLPAQLVKDLAEFDVVNVGAAGTVLVRGVVALSALRREISARLPFEAEMAIVKAATLWNLRRALRLASGRRRRTNSAYHCAPSRASGGSGSDPGV